MTTVAALLPIIKAHQDILVSIQQVQAMEKSIDFASQLSGQLDALEEASTLIEGSLASLLASTVIESLANGKYTVQYYYAGSIE